MGSVKQQLYDVALDGQGFVLAGDPVRPAIRMKQQPVFGNRFAQGDRDLHDLSFWWFWAQRDFSGGLKDEKVWKDDAKFRFGEAVNTFSEPGLVKVLNGQTSEEAFSAVTFDRITSAAYGGLVGGIYGIIGLRGEQVTPSKSAIYATTDGTTYSDITAAGMGTDGRAILGIRFLNIGTGLVLIVTASNGTFTFGTYNGTTHSDITSTVEGAETMSTTGSGQGCEVAGGRTWTFHRNAARELIIQSTADLATFTVRKRIPNAFYKGSCDLGGDLLYVVSIGSSIVELHKYDVAADTDTVVYRWKGPSLANLVGVSGGAASGSCVGSVDGVNAYVIFDSGEIWKYDGSSVEKVYGDPAGTISTSLGFGLVSHEGTLLGPNVTINFDGSIHPGYRYVTSSSTAQALPLISMRFTADSAAVVFSTNNSTTTTFTTLYRQTLGNQIGIVTTSEHDGGVPGIDKLYRSIVIEFDKFSTSGQAIIVYYATDGGTSFTEIGRVSYDDDGAVTSKEFFFADNFIYKTLVLRFEIVNSTNSATGSPGFRGFSCRFLPVPNYKQSWTVTLNCSDSILLKDGKTLESKTGEQLRNIIRESWWMREVVSFEGIDGDTFTLNGSISKTATTLTLNQTTHNLAERGRGKIDDEEIFWNGKNQSQLLNLTRGVRGTVAASHSDAASVTTAYDVIITDYQEQLIVANRVKDREYLSTVQLLEA